LLRLSPKARQSIHRIATRQIAPISKAPTNAPAMEK
jgi:hypothetical protein